MLKQKYIPILLFLVILSLVFPYPGEFATSVVPGWHTTIFPPSVIWELAILLLIVLVLIGYWLLSRKAGPLSWTLFAIHVLLTLPAVVFLKFPFILFTLTKKEATQEELLNWLSIQTTVIAASWIAFVVGQILFGVYFILNITKKSQE